jgi:hypothetical protein
MISAFMLAAAACSEQTKAPENKAQTTQNTSPNTAPTDAPKPPPVSKKPANNITVADIAKIKWLEGSYRGTGAEKPFFNRYRFNGTTLNIESYDDEAMTKKVDSAVYELKDGMYANPSGKDRFAATEITDAYVQFVTMASEKPAALKMERQGDGSVKATLEWTGPDGNPTQRSFILERLNK